MVGIGEKPNIYNVKVREITSYQRMENDLEISAENKQHIVDFYNHCKSSGLSKLRLIKMLCIMIRLGKFTPKDFVKCGKNDIQIIVNKILDTNLAPATRRDYLVFLKKFYKWLKPDADDEDKMPKEVSWIKLKKCDCKKIAEDMLNDDDILRIIKASNVARNKAIVSSLYETGLRAGEFLSIRIKDVKKGDPCWSIAVTNSKTEERTIYIFESIPYLAEYLRMHPYSEDPAAFLWYKQSGAIKKGNKKDDTSFAHEPIGYARLRTIVADMSIRAGIKKPYNLHNFRHSSITKSAKYLPDQQLKKKYGWSKGSEQLATYTHLSNRDLQDAELKARGLNHNGEGENKMQLLVCRRCNTANTPEQSICTKCNYPLNRDAAEFMEKLRDEAMRNVEKLLEIKMKSGMDGNVMYKMMRKLDRENEAREDTINEPV